MKKTLSILAAALVLGMILVQLFDRYLDSENVFWGEAVRRSNDWANKLDARFPQKFVIVGGSSSRTSIDPELLLEEYGIPLVNASLPAGFGISIHIAGAMPYLRRGDTLILCLEPLLLATSTSESKTHTTNGDKFLAYHLSTRHSDELPNRNLSDAARLLRGHSYQIIVRTIRHFVGKTPYRYSRDELSPAGWLNVSSKFPLYLGRCNVARSIATLLPAPWAEQYLRRVVAWGKENGVDVIYALPRCLWAEDSRIYHAVVALRLMEIMPVLKDRTLGTDDDASHFADTVNHTSSEGARLMTREWGRALASGDYYWTRAELLDYIHSRGWNEDGTPRASEQSAGTRQP